MIFMFADSRGDVTYTPLLLQTFVVPVPVSIIYIFLKESYLVIRLTYILTNIIYYKFIFLQFPLTTTSHCQHFIRLLHTSHVFYMSVKESNLLTQVINKKEILRDLKQ